MPLAAAGDGEILPCEGPDVSGLDAALERTFQLEGGGQTAGALADLNAGDVSLDGERYSACAGTTLGGLAAQTRPYLSLLLFVISALLGWRLTRMLIGELNANRAGGVR